MRKHWRVYLLTIALVFGGLCSATLAASEAGGVSLGLNIPFGGIQIINETNEKAAIKADIILYNEIEGFSYSERRFESALWDHIILPKNATYTMTPIENGEKLDVKLGYPTAEASWWYSFPIQTTSELGMSIAVTDKVDHLSLLEIGAEFKTYWPCEVSVGSAGENVMIYAFLSGVTTADTQIHADPKNTLLIRDASQITVEYRMVPIGLEHRMLPFPEWLELMDSVSYDLDGQDISMTVGDMNVYLAPFSDVTLDAWYVSAVWTSVSEGLMNGTSAITFAPNESLSRAMLVTILHRMEGTPSAVGGNFTDVVSGSYYANAVFWAQENGIVKGTSDTTFSPNQNISREQIATILMRYVEYKNETLDADSGLTASSFSDYSSVSSYARDAMDWAVSVGLISGKDADTLAPNGNATRAEAATLLQRLLSQI